MREDVTSGKRPSDIFMSKEFSRRLAAVRPFPSISVHKFVLSLISAVAISTPAFADQLADIKARGTLICGVFSGAEPFAFQDATTHEVKGYDIDVCKGVAAHMGLKPELKVISLDARIPELQQGRVDILAALLGYTPARAEQVAYSDAYFVSRQMILVKDPKYKELDDVGDKRVSTVKGSSNIPFLQKALPKANIVSYDDAPTAFMALVQGKADAHAVSEVVARRFVQKMGEQNTKLEVLEPEVGIEYWGLGIKKGEPALESAVNDALVAMDKAGEIDKIFNQWLGSGSAYQMTRTFTVSPIPR
jgi:polar amino acid transport system substrate-binding protein